MHQTDVSVVVPAYNAENSLDDLVERLVDVLEARQVSFELIFVNDGSTDATWQVLHALSVQDTRVRAIDLLANSGQPMATLAGLSVAQGSVVCTMDDDGQHPPEQLPTLLDSLLEHPEWDAVVGSWHRDNSRFRNLGTAVYTWADRLAWGTPPGFRHTAFRAMRRPAVDALVAQKTVHPVIGPLLRQVAGEVHNVTVEHAERTHGTSGLTFKDGLSRAFRNFSHGSTLPLKLLSIVGLTASTSAIALAVGLAIRWILGSRGPEGWLSAVASTLFMGGLILFAIGILGQYILLIVQEVRRPPQWNVRRTAGLDE